MIYAFCMMTRTRKSIGSSFFRPSGIPLYHAAVSSGLQTAVCDFIFNDKSLKNLPLEQSIKMQFALDLCRLVASDRCISWLYGMAGTGKTGYLVCLYSAIVRLHFVAREILEERMERDLPTEKILLDLEGGHSSTSR